MANRTEQASRKTNQSSSK